ncbi:hypothetical protein GOBAR_AA07384 [Gossypium barbadense]|uniref:Uncharacterized protein n=1 Tax=Gossypium barbadense TaxID=3634 RepID=A0A2P5YCC3_GOSBA|nr:hypothetical protein GOBAR_AA07384 [Gossypium barbadense]
MDETPHIFDTECVRRGRLSLCGLGAGEAGFKPDVWSKSGGELCDRLKVVKRKECRALGGTVFLNDRRPFPKEGSSVVLYWGAALTARNEYYSTEEKVMGKCSRSIHLGQR